MRRVACLTTVALLAAGLGACGDSGGGAATSATVAATTPPATTSTRPSGTSTVTLAVPAALRGGGLDGPRRVTVPTGWTASTWARVDGARFAVWAPDGTLLVSASGAGEVVAFTPGRDGTATSRTLLRGLKLPSGLAFDTLHGRRVLYVAESDRVDRYRWTNGRLGTPTVVIDHLPDEDPQGDDDHRPKSIAVARDHAIVVSIGSADNASPPRKTTPVRGSIVSYRPTGGAARVLATGVRNGEGLSYAPDGTLWTAVNNRDQIAYPYHGAYAGEADAYGKVIPAYVNEHPAEQVARVTTGRNLGWPYCDPNPDESPDRSDPFANVPYTADVQTNAGGVHLDCAKLAPVERGIPAHSAPLGFHFLQGTTVPAAWRPGAALAVHGSWDRTPPRAPAVLWLPWEAKGRTLGAPRTLMGGFQNDDGSRWGRPVDVVPGPDGALYVTDDAAGAVYRLAPPR
jgi:glucose/arabinose dehydrogenase